MKRNTIQKKAIKQVFEEQNRPLKIEEVLFYARDEVASLNQSTVYRNLNSLVESGWLKRIVHPELGHLYEKVNPVHHHHFHCRQCNCAFTLQGCALNHDYNLPEGFTTDNHQVFFSGVCNTCND